MICDSLWLLWGLPSAVQLGICGSSSGFCFTFCCGGSGCHLHLMGFACFLMLQLLSTSWILLVATSPAAVALVNNPGKVEGFIWCYTSPFNVGGSHKWAVSSFLGSGGLSGALGPGLSFWATSCTSAPLLH